MSDREDIDVVKSENTSDEKIINDPDKDNNQAIRQTSPAHSDEKTTKPSLLERLKMVFYTEDIEYTNEDGNSQTSDGLDNTEESVFKGIFDKIKNSGKKPETNKDFENNQLNKTIISETSEKNNNNEEQEKSETNSTDNKNEEISNTTDNQPQTEETQSDYDPEEEAEFAMINAILDGESIDDMKFPDDENTQEDKDISENKLPEQTEEPAEDKSSEKTEEPTEDKSSDKTEEPAEDKFSDKTEEPAEDKSSEKTEEPVEDKSSEKTEEPSEDKSSDKTEEPAEDKSSDKTEEPSEDKSSEKKEESTEDKSSENTEKPTEDKLPEKAEDDGTGDGKDIFDNLDIVIEDDDIQEGFDDDENGFVFAEFDVDDESGGVDSINIDETTAPSESQENQKGNVDISLDNDEAQHEAEEDNDEEIIEEENTLPFDESNDEDGADDKSNKEIHDDGASKSEQWDKKTDESTENSEQSDKKTDESTENSEQSDKKSDESTENSEQSDKKSDESTENSEQSDKKSDESTENSEQSDKKSDESTENSEQSDKKSDESTENSEQSDKKSDESTENSDKKPDESTEKSEKKSGVFKDFYSKAKNKLTVMWNTMDDGTVQTSQSNRVSLSKDNGNNSENRLQENTEHEPKTIPDSEPEPILNTESEEETEQTYGENLYKDMFGGESELDKYRRQLYGDDYNKEEEQEETHENDVSSFFADSVVKDGAAQGRKLPARITVIRNDSPENVDRSDRAAVRESLNVIERDPREAVLTEDDKKQEEKNQQVLEKVKIFEQEYAQRKEQHEQEREERARKNAIAYEKKFGTAKHVSEIEINNYEYPDQYEYIKVKAGLFSESVKTEYDFYLGYSKLQNVAKRQLKIDTDSNPAKKEPVSANPAAGSGSSAVRSDEGRYSAVYDAHDNVERELDKIDKQNPNSFEYRSEEEAGKVRQRIHGELKRYKSRFTTEAILTAAIMVLCLFSGKFSVGGGENVNTSSVRWFAVLNFLIYTFSIYNVRSIVIHGLKSLVKLKSNRDTSIALAGVVIWVQSFAAVITPVPFLRQGLTLYAVIIMLIFSLNTYGRYLNAVRINMNFRFVSDSSQKYTGKFFHDQRMLATLLSGMRNEKSDLVFQKKTTFLKHFIKLSKMHDPGEELSKKFAFPTLAFTVLMTLIYGALSHDFCETLSFLSIMLCVSVPVCSQLLGALPLGKLSREALQNQSMVVGYPAVERFSDSGAVMIDAKELYPEGSVHLSMLKTFDDRRKDEAVIAAAAIMIAAGGAASGIFDELIGQRLDMLPKAENVMYQDGKGLIGWVDGERYFIGNRQLLLSHGMQPADIQYEEEQKQGSREILYLARSGEVIAMFIVTYDANRRVADALRRMEANGMTLLIRTTDANITAERIAADFGVYYKNIKILEQKNANFIRDEMIGKEKASPAFIATKGGVTSFGRAVSECIRAKNNISLSVAIQVFAVLLELLVVSLFGVLARVSIHTMPWVFFSIFWIAATLAGPVIVQKFQK